MIVNIRGTHGSGKSWLVRQFLKWYNHKTIGTDRKPEGYVLRTDFGKLYVVGSYKNDCGGCDAIQPYALIWPRVLEYAEDGHVLFEGALVSNGYGLIGSAGATMPDRFTFAHLNTPLLVCQNRILQRRKAAGNNKPFDPSKSLNRVYRRSIVALDKALGAGGRVVTLPYADPLPKLLKCFTELLPSDYVPKVDYRGVKISARARSLGYKVL